MYPILGRYGPFFFYSYTAVVGSGLLIALALLRKPARRAIGERWWHGVVLALLVGLWAGRAGFVASQLDYFRLHPGETWRLWLGGLNYHAALLAALGTLFLWTRVQAISFYRLAALLAPGALLWASAGWIACWLHGCAYGRETALGWMAADLPDQFGVYAVRYQTQLVGASLFLFLAFLIWRLRSRLPAGPLFWFALAVASAGRALISLWRGDPMLEVLGWRLDTIIDSLLALSAASLFLGMAVRRDLTHRPTEENDEPESWSRTD
ncbi:MAG: prolipoprotein diacylglyceryl transferase [Anaerolineae bacterium]|nr:prolipoprotein diacylglyceryl transferase [Anaerolineae bacterium]